MHPLKDIKTLLQPSVSSFSLILLLTIVIVAAGLWFSDVRTGVLFNTLVFGSSASTITTSQTTLSQLNDRLLGNPVLNKILFFGTWLFIGCLVYIIVSAIIAFGNESVETAEEMHYMHASQQKLKGIFLSRLGLRLVSFGLLLFYAVFFNRLLMPYSSYAVRVGANQASLLSAILYIGLGGLVLLASLHIFVVLIRLVALRTRLFS